jgi:hypothetical protein
VGAERSEDLLQHTLRIRKHIVIPEADHAPASLHQVSAAHHIQLGLRMLTAVDFDDQPAFDTGEVGEIGRYGVLATERPSVELMVAKSYPQAPLGFGHVSAKAAGALSCWTDQLCHGGSLYNLATLGPHPNPPPR